MSTQKHPAVVTVTPGGPLEIRNVPTPSVARNQVKVMIEWTASTPLDLHQADGHLLVKPPQVLGDGIAGSVVEVGPDVRRLKPGDQVFGFGWRSQSEKAHQLYAVTEENVLAKLPVGRTLQEAVTVPNNFVTAWYALRKHLCFQLPWPKPQSYVPPEVESWILVWGGSSSVGMYALQILKHYGYRKIITTASKPHHERLIRYGAQACLDYRDDDIVGRVQDAVQRSQGHVDFALDCIGSLHGSVEPLAHIVTKKAAKIAILLPVITRDAAPGVRPEFELDARACAAWAEDVEVSGVRTHTYMDDDFLAENLQPAIMPWALLENVVEPNDQVVVKGDTLLERAERALSLLRDKEVSGGRLVWRIAEDADLARAMSGISK